MNTEGFHKETLRFYLNNLKYKIHLKIMERINPSCFFVKTLCDLVFRFKTIRW